MCPFLVLAQADRSAQSKKASNVRTLPAYVPSERVMLDLLGPLRRLFWKPASSNPVVRWTVCRPARWSDDLPRYLRETEKQEIIITRHAKYAGVLIGF